MLTSNQSDTFDINEEIDDITIKSREHRSQERENALQRVMDIDNGKNTFTFDRTNKKITYLSSKAHVTFELTLICTYQGAYTMTTRISKFPGSTRSKPLERDFWESYKNPNKIWFHVDDEIQDFKHFTDETIQTDLITALYAAKMRRVIALIDPKTVQIMKEKRCELRLIKDGTEIEFNAKNKDTEITS